MIPTRYQHVEYSDVPEDIRTVFDQIKKTRQGLFIHGGVGTGKTHIAYALKKEYDRTSMNSSYFWNTTELLRELKEDFDRPYGEKKNILERLMTSKTLIILDDIGAEKISDWVQETFYLLINKKYNDCFPIVFTSNYSLAELNERIGERIVSRILEMCDRFKVDGVDRRFDKAVNQ